MVVDHIATVMSPALSRGCRSELPSDLALDIALMFMKRCSKEDDSPDTKAFEQRLESYTESANGC